MVSFCLGATTLGVSAQLMPSLQVGQGEAGLHQISMMCSPVADHGPADWHRDTDPVSEPPVGAIAADMQHNGAGYIQWNIALYDDSVLWVVPGSHRRDLSETEVHELAGSARGPLSSGLQIKLRAGDGVAYVNHILHWGSNYSTTRRRTIHLAYQAFAASTYRYFHLWWDPAFRAALADAEHRRVFGRWSALIDKEHSHIAEIFGAMVARDGKGFRQALAKLHSAPHGRMTTVMLLCKEAFKMAAGEGVTHHCLRNPTIRGPNARARHLYDDVTRRMPPGHLAILCERFAELDRRLRVSNEEEARRLPAQANQNSRRTIGPFGFERFTPPQDFGIDEFVASWETTSSPPARL